MAAQVVGNCQRTSWRGANPLCEGLVCTWIQPDSARKMERCRDCTARESFDSTGKRGGPLGNVSYAIDVRQRTGGAEKVCGRRAALVAGLQRNRSAPGDHYKQRDIARGRSNRATRAVVRRLG